MSFESMNHYCKPVACVPPRLCNYCFSNGMDLNFAMSHNERDYKTNQILCPNLINIYCKYCKQHGHTINHCEILLCKKKLKNMKKMKKINNYKNKKVNNKKQKYEPQTPPGSPPRTPPRISPDNQESEDEIIVINGIEQFDPPPVSKKLKNLKQRIKKNKNKLFTEKNDLGETKGPMKFEELFLDSALEDYFSKGRMRLEELL